MKLLKKLSLYSKFYVLYGFRWLIPLKKTNYLFISMSGNSYGGNPKAFSDYLQNRIENINLFWAESENLIIVDQNVKPLKLYSWRYFYSLLQTQIIVSDQRLWKPMMPRKRKKQLYVQVWHGTALKKIEADMPNLELGYQIMAERDSKYIDVFLSGSSFMTQIYQTSFWYDGKMLEIGTPRNDIFFNSNNMGLIQKIKDFYGINEEKIILYAPTFRAEGSLEACHMDTNAIFKSLGGTNKWKVLVRLHPNLMGSISQNDFSELYPKTINASTYPDMQELLCATDLLITDYSSSMFDFMYTGKPCILFATDINTYDRGFYISIRDLPFPIAETNEQLINILSSNLHLDYSSFLYKIGSFENGTASQQLYEYIKKKCL